MAVRPLFRWKRLLQFILALGLLFILLQFVRPRLRNSPVTAEIQAPPEVRQILKTSCYNCHSNQTRLSWFDEPVPAYWLVIQDVREGRKHLNFSEAGKLPVAQQRAILFEAISQIELGAMPLPAYQRLHPESALSPEQLEILKKYLSAGVLNEPATASDASAADAEYDHWIKESGASPAVAPAPNGISFMPEYKNWKAISSTDRFDNHSMREVLGNDVAVKAIAENHINPWPDGTAFAKVAWLQEPDQDGMVQTGAFYQVEFMIRDSKKYAHTLGWGWARWRGTGLKPYGKDKNFTRECVGCHRPLSRTDHVFTEPIRGQL